MRWAHYDACGGRSKASRCAVDERHLQNIVARALLLLTSLAVLAGAATIGDLSIRAGVVLALVLLVPGLLWLALRP